MDVNGNSAKRPCYRCDDCCTSYADNNTLGAHFKTNCPKTFHRISSTVFPQAVSYPPDSHNFHHPPHPDVKSLQVTSSLRTLQHPSQFPSEVETNQAKADQHLPDFISATSPSQSLIDTLKSLAQSGQISPHIFLSLENCKIASARKGATLAAYAASCTEVLRVSVQYSEAVNRTTLALKVLNNTINGHEELCALSSEQEQLIMNDMLSKSLANARSACKNEEILTKSLEEAIWNQREVSRAAFADIDHEQTALDSAIKTYVEVETPTEITLAVFEELMNAQKQVQSSINYLTSLREKVRKQKVAVWILINAALSAAHQFAQCIDEGSSQETGASVE